MKISDISKAFNLNSKEVIAIFKDIDPDKKASGAAVSDDEFEMFFSVITKARQIKDIDAYTSGRVTITQVREKAEKPAEATEEKKAAAPETVKTAVPETVKAQTPEVKVQDKPTSREEKKNDTQSARRTDAAERTDRQKPSFDNQRAQQQQRQGDRRDGQRQVQNQNRDKQNGQTYYAPKNSYQRYNDRPSDDPFAKRREEMQRNANGKPQKLGQQGQQSQQRQNVATKPNDTAAVKPKITETAKPETVKTEVKKPETAQATVRPAQAAQLEKQQKPKVQQQAQAQKPQKREEKKAQKQQFKTITPAFDPTSVKGGVNINTDYSADAPKTRVVDMSSTDVDLSKYDDRYNEHFFAIANGTDTKASKQKLKKQDNRGQNAKSAKDKERAAQEKIKRLEAERARQKQLEFTVPDEITVGEFASRLKKTSAEVIKKLMLMGEMKGVNDVIDYATAELIADEFGAKVTKEVVVTIEERLFTEAEDADGDLVERAPVVCVMGHVDHGKTSILDAIRHTSVTKGEAGGITQAIGAYRVKAQNKDITFLDTPGHEAFTAMRMRGAKSTDIAILVVAADDGVMPQTIEAINHAKAAGIDIIVAINKMDKPQANPDNVLNQLTQYELVPEAWGGDVICVPVSALTGMGIEDLLESVLLIAEVKELKANPNRRARGLVIESKLDRGRGPVATVLVQNGTLHQGDYVIVGNAVGRVRLMVDDKGKSVKVAGPSTPVEIIGLDDVPQAGDELNAVEDERMARSLAEQRREKLRQEILAANARVNLDDLFSQIADGVKTLNVIVKADVAGSAEAVKASLVKLSNEEVKVSVIHSAVGGITESDVMLAAASNAIIVGFSVRPDKNAIDSAERNNVDIRTHRIIYEIIDEVEAAMKGMLAPTFKEVILGHAEVRQTIRVPNVGTIAGSYVRDGKITRQSEIRVIRDGIVIFEDKISSLRRFKDDVREVNESYECGVGLDKFNDIKEGDILEAYIMEEVKR